MMQGLTRFFTSIVQRYLPDPFVFAIILSIIVFVVSTAITPNSPVEILNMWGSGFWNLLGFTMQMVLVVVTGHALASSEIVKKILKSCASIPKTPTQGVMLVTFVGSIACIINWGFGLIIGAMLAKEVAKSVDKSDYPLLIACAYIAFLVWHGGFSGSIPLLAATPGNPVEKICGLVSINDTLFTKFNLIITGSLVVCLPFLTAKMLPQENERKFINPELLKDETSSIQRTISKESTIAEKVEESKILALLVGISGLAYILYTWFTKGFKLDINSVNLLFLSLGIILHKTPMAYARAISLAAKSTAGIIVQFPFYAGIQAMLEHSGLGGVITDFFINIADKHTFPLFAFLSSAMINFAIPSGGGHWVVQGPFIMSAAKSLGADYGHAVMAIAYGEAWMNMAQPFWALPALAIAGLGARDIMGYCLITLFLSGIVFIGGLMLF
ncbi:MAG: TIGR00366 family protein [Neisseriaceae bacterium]|nr:MAG: TIGR00366 family protein [Neisseriaceae bacterium]